MKNSFLLGTASALFLASAAAFAQAPAGAPAGSTGSCKDGSYTSNETKKGACAGHKGVKEWFAANAAPSKSSTKNEMTPATVPNAPAAPSEPGAATTPMKPKAMTKPGDTAKPAEGGGPGKVWVNASSKVYHCPGTKYYGATKEGSYMTEAEAKSAGAHADHGKACS